MISLTGHGDLICCVDGRDWMLIKVHRYTVAGIHGIFPFQDMLPIWNGQINRISFQFQQKQSASFFVILNAKERDEKRIEDCLIVIFIQRFAFVNSSGSGIVMKNQQFNNLFFLLLFFFSVVVFFFFLFLLNVEQTRIWMSKSKDIN